MGSRLKKGHKALIAVAAVLLAIVASVLVVSARQQRELDAKIAAAREAGFPFEADALDFSDEFPESENAAPYYLSALQIFDSTAFTDKEGAEMAMIDFFNGSADAQALSTLKQYVAECRPAMDEFVRASKLPHCYFEKDWAKGYMVLFPEYARAKNLSRALMVEGAMLADQGDFAGAAERCRAVLRAARHMNEQPVVIGMLVSAALDGMVARELEAWLPYAAKSEAAARELSEVALALREDWDVERAFVAEAYFAWWVAERTSQLPELIGIDYGFNDEHTVLTRILGKTPMFERSFKISVLDIYTPAIRAEVTTENAREVLGAVYARAQREASHNRMTGPYLELLTYVNDQLADSLDWHIAERRCLLAALDVLEHQRKQGTLPDALPKAYADPFSDGPLRYERTSHGFKAWSVGQDRRDDGGTPKSASAEEYDEVLVYPPK